MTKRAKDELLALPNVGPSIREDLRRLGLDLPLMSCMQTVQHTLRLRRSGHVVETQGRTDAFSVQDVH